MQKWSRGDPRNQKDGETVKNMTQMEERRPAEPKEYRNGTKRSQSRAREVKTVKNMTQMEERRPARDQRGSQKEAKGRRGCQQVPKWSYKGVKIEPKDDQTADGNGYPERHTKMIPKLI